jgi:putative ABC transport system permease protein
VASPLSFGTLPRIVLRSLLHNRLRTGLTVLGVAIGIAAVICTAALGAAGTSRVQAQMDAVGEDFIWIRAGSRSEGGSRTGWGGARTLSAEDAAAIPLNVPDVTACSPQVGGREQLVTGGRNWNTRYQGVLPSYFEIRKRRPIAGSLFIDVDERDGARVMVLGSSVSEQLFPGENPVGRDVRMNRFVFRVIGVLEPRGVDRGGLDRDDTVFVPFSTSLRSLDRRDYVTDILCGVRAPERVAAAEIQVAALLRDLHELDADDEDDFEIEKPLERLELRAGAARTMTVMLTGIGAVSLIVGGVGIMNIMLVTVAERRREIGIRLAIGARIRDIRWQFLLEAAAIGLVGGLFGIALGWIGARVLTLAFEWPTIVPLDAVIGATAAAIGAGLVFGYYPAHHASELDPIHAIRADD